MKTTLKKEITLDQADLTELVRRKVEKRGWKMEGVSFGDGVGVIAAVDATATLSKESAEDDEPEVIEAKDAQ